MTRAELTQRILRASDAMQHAIHTAVAAALRGSEATCSSRPAVISLSAIMAADGRSTSVIASP